MTAETIAATQLIDWLRSAAETVASHRQELTDLDAAIGDADHGVNLDRGFRTVLARLEAESLADGDAATIARAAAMALISSVGGAAGPLYGTFFMRLGTALGSRRHFSIEELAAAFRAGVEGIAQRGKANLGDKTMLDALHPAATVLEEKLTRGEGPIMAWDAAERAAQQGMNDTIPLVARKGRASYLGERSVGHQDPGATSAYLLVKAAAEVFGRCQKLDSE